MLIINKYIYEIGLVAPLAQAAIWGGSSLLANKLASNKNFKSKLSPEEKAHQQRMVVASTIAGGLAGATGSLIDSYLKKKRS